MANMQGFFFHDFKNAHITDILTEIYKEKIYDPYVGSSSDLTILDIGANVGLCSYYFSNYAKQVYAVEPAQMHYHALEKMVDFNNLSNVTCIKAAIGVEDGVQPLYHNTNVTCYSLCEAVNNENISEDVEVMRFDTFFKKYGIKQVDFLKLDIEGHEVSVLSSEGFANVAKNIKTIVGEYHAWTFTTQDQILNVLRDRGFKADKISGSDANLFIATRV
jgi:FkbM family methyltransferase